MKLGFMGAGNMASAIGKGVLVSGAVTAEEMYIYDVNENASKALKGEGNAHVCKTAEEMIRNSDIVLLAVKPNVAPVVLKENFEALSGRAVISIVAGLTSEVLSGMLPADARYLRVMPNTPALVLSGMAALSEENTLTAEERAFAESVFSAIGEYTYVHEYQMEAVIGVSGSGPAYVYMFIEALADAGVANGLTRAQSVKMAAQTVLGSAKMVLETGRHPGDLKDMVCSPGGTTIRAVMAAEEKGLRAAAMAAVEAATQKANEMAGK